MERKVMIGLPAYNEAAALPKLIRKIELMMHDLPYETFIFIVNDGSSDQTEHILQTFARKHRHIRFMSHPSNQGLGEAWNTMFRYACSRFDANDLLITMDADNTHNPGIVPDMVRKLTEDGLDVVIASRFVKGGREIGLSPLRKVTSRGASLLLKLALAIPNVNDYTSGYRCYRIGFLQHSMRQTGGALVTSKGFESTAEIMARFSRIGVRAGEYPLVLEYNLKEGRSKMKVGRTIRGYVTMLKAVNKKSF